MDSRELKRYGMAQGAYNGANRRRFVLFTSHDASTGNVTRREFDTKRERDAFARKAIEGLDNV